MRVTRLSRMITRLNVARETKNVLKLLQLLFFFVLYLHVLGCIWFFVVRMDNNWQAPLDSINDDSDLYSSSLLY